MRSFIALPIADQSLDALIALQPRIPVGRPVAEDNLHLTLAFLGEVAPPELDALHDDLSLLRAAPVEVRFTGLDSFTEMQYGLVFAGVEATRELEALQATIARIVRRSGIDLPRRRFRPHVTLTRANRRPDGPARDRLAAILGAQAEPIPGYRADRVCLYHSDIRPNGARHEVLAEYPLTV